MNSVMNDKAYYYYSLKALQECFITPLKTTLKGRWSKNGYKPRPRNRKLKN